MPRGCCTTAMTTSAASTCAPRTRQDRVSAPTVQSHGNMAGSMTPRRRPTARSTPLRLVLQVGSARELAEEVVQFDIGDRESDQSRREKFLTKQPHTNYPDPGENIPILVFISSIVSFLFIRVNDCQLLKRLRLLILSESRGKIGERECPELVSTLP